MGDISTTRQLHYQTAVAGNRWLSDTAFELRLFRPAGFKFRPGQKVLLGWGRQSREYTIAKATKDEILFCIKHVADGEVSSKLARVDAGDNVMLSDGYGFFVHRPGSSVFVATGTGIAPFLAFAESGISDYVLLHGVSSENELYYRQELEKPASKYVACISRDAKYTQQSDIFFPGRVTAYLENEMKAGIYDFYLCGSGEMIRDVMTILDYRYKKSRIFTEIFY